MYNVISTKKRADITLNCVVQWVLETGVYIYAPSYRTIKCNFLHSVSLVAKIQSLVNV